MLYSFENNIIEINNLYDGSIRRFDLSSFSIGKKLDVNHVTATRDRSNVALSFQVVDRDEIQIVKRHNEGVLLCDMNTGDITVLSDKTCHDVIFDRTDNDKLYINTNGTIESLCVTDKTINKIYKFRNFVEAPIEMKQSEDGKYLLFHKYKSDNKTMHLINLEANALESVIGSTFVYDFLNNNEIVHALMGGIKVYNITNKKNVSAITKANKLLKLGKNSADVHQISEALQITGQQDYVGLNDVTDPHVFCERIYFKVRITSKQKDFCKWCSVDKNFDDFQIHFSNPYGYGRGRIHSYGDNDRKIFVIFCGYKGCHVFDGDEVYALDECIPVLMN